MTAPPEEEGEEEKPKPIKGISLPTIPLEEQETTEEAETKDETPEDWLADLRHSTEEVEETSVTEFEDDAEPAPEPAEIPDWLQEMAPAEAEAPEAEPPAAEPAPEPAEAPDWLQEMEPAEAEVPEAESSTTEPMPEEALFTEPLSDSDEVPDWLQEMEPAEAEAPEAEPPAAEPAPEPAEVPDWLQEMEPAEAEAPEAEPPAAEPAPEEAVAVEEAPPPFAEELALEEAEIPDWLAELGEEAVPPVEDAEPGLPPEVGIEAAETAEALARADIPDWLEDLRPSPEAEAKVAAAEPVETEGLLEGLRGLIPAAPSIKAPPTYDGALPAEASEASLARAQLLQSLLSQPAERPKAKVSKRDFRIEELIQRWLVTLALVLAVIAPLMPVDIPILTQPVESPNARQLHDTLAWNLDETDTVLVAFEYGPTEADELDPVAGPILDHILDQGAHISVASTRPDGPAVASKLLSDIVTSTERYSATQYTLLDYRPGGVTGVSQLLTAAEPRPTLLLVLTAQPASLRQWIEQVRALYDNDFPVVAGLSAAVEPFAKPYLDSAAGQLTGAIHGLSGAAAYEAIRGSSGSATQHFAALTTGHIAVVGLMILGAVLYGFSGLLRKEER